MPTVVRALLDRDPPPTLHALWAHVAAGVITAWGDLPSVGRVSVCARVW